MNKFFLFIIPFSFFLFTACEEEITVDLPNGEEAIVVEGYISNGEGPIVILTRDLPYFASVNQDELNSIFVKNAFVQVSDGTDTVDLQEIEIEIPGSDGLFASVYFSFGMTGEIGKTYSLLVEAEGKTLSALTTIPAPVPLDSIHFEEATDENSPFPVDEDSLYRLIVDFIDPGGTDNYYRYYTSRNNDSYRSNLSSSFAVILFDGQPINNIWLPAGNNIGDTIDNADYFSWGDIVGLQWCSIDRDHYQFWDTYEDNVQAFGPFAPPTVVKSNIQGGLGLWGGQGCTFYENLIVKEE